MTDSTPKTNPMDDYENGVITFDELTSIILAMPQKPLSPERQAYYQRLAEEAESDEFTISTTGKSYWGEEARQRGRDMLRAALEPNP